MDWKHRLLQTYVSTGQAVSPAVHRHALRINDYPHFVRIIRRYVPADRDLRIADLACGHGALVFCLKQLGYRFVEGVDVSREQIALARELGLKEVSCMDIASFLKEREAFFDVIFLMDILEHLTKSELLELLDLAHGSLRKNGRAILQVPNGEGIFGMSVRYGDLTHETCFTRHSISQTLNACRFSGVQCIEEKPVVHGLKSLVRRSLWTVLTVLPRVLFLAETGERSHILSRNMLVIASRGAV
jgi:2-polyprenyl-3-methyl-5-hydroxy-6-metoxy-1,4-benzoquinol methylase